MVASRRLLYLLLCLVFVNPILSVFAVCASFVYFYNSSVLCYDDIPWGLCGFVATAHLVYNSIFCRCMRVRLDICPAPRIFVMTEHRIAYVESEAYHDRA